MRRFVAVLAVPVLALACASGPEQVAVAQSQGMAQRGLLADLQARIDEDPRLLNEKGGNGATLLHFAAGNGQLAVIEYLLSKGLDINAQDKQGWTPLAIAVQRKQPAAVRALLEKGADKSVKDDNGFTIGENAFLAKNPAVNEVLKEFGIEVAAPKL